MSLEVDGSPYVSTSAYSASLHWKANRSTRGCDPGSDHSLVEFEAGVAKHPFDLWPGQGFAYGVRVLAGHRLLGSLLNVETIGNRACYRFSVWKDLERLEANVRSWFHDWPAEGFFSAIEVPG